jgi:transcriptional regulator with XRE-family HTH domain
MTYVQERTEMKNETGDPGVSRLLVIFLRSYADLSQTELAAAMGSGQSTISRYEVGREIPAESSLRRMADAAGIPWTVVVRLRRFYETVFDVATRRERVAARTGSGAVDRAFLEAALLAASPSLVRLEALDPGWRSPEEERREAAEIWTALERFPMARRRRLLELSQRARRNGALAERIRQESERAAADHRPEEARELAELARWIADQVPEGAVGRASVYNEG